jgi:hypothetical protein
VQSVFHEAVAHRIFFNPVYEWRRTPLVREMTSQILQRVEAP